MTRILLLECMQEISSFNPVKSQFDDFTVQRGDEMLTQAGTNTAIGGVLKELQNHTDVEVVPVISARASSGGPLSAAGWDELADLILHALADNIAPGDGVYFSMHGAMGAESELDPEGALLAGARKMIGDASPIVISLDLHGILTDRMLTNIDGLTAYKTYPHVDFADTGARAARLLVDIVKGRVDPIIVRTRIPALVRGNELITETGCYGALIDDTQNLERTKRCLSAGLMIGNPFTDVPELCSQVFVVTDGDEHAAEEEATRLARSFWGQRQRMQAQLISLDAAIAEAKAMPSPVIFTDAADATSSGASGDSVEIVKALVEANFAGRILAPVVDQSAAEIAHRAGVGASVEVKVGASLDSRFSSLSLTAEVAVLSDGRAKSETSGHRLDAGPSAVLVADNLTLLVMSRSVQLFDRAMFFAHRQDPKSFDLIVVKSPYCEHHMFDDWAEKNFNIDAPGSTSANVAALGHIRCERPMYPLDDDFEFVVTSAVYRRAG